MFRQNYITLFGVVLALTAPFLIKVTRKNTCTTYFDYFLINFGGNCYYNPDVDLSVPELIKKYAGNVQSYSVTTEDGYILSMFRILKKDPLGAVLLQPPISAGAIAWLSDGSQSLAFELWKQGYDVWLSNHRGASYSRKHITLSENDSKFWDNSFHEIAQYDLDAQFEVIWEKTNNSQVIFIGYSLSSTIGLTYAAMKPESSKRNVKSYILVAPVVTMKHFRSPFKFIFYFMRPFENILRTGEFMTMEAVRWFGQFLNVVPILTNIASSIVMGWTFGEMDPVLYPYIFAHHGRGITNKMIYHYSQIFFNQTHFVMYDYGKDINRNMYSNEWPSVYGLQDIETPVYAIYGDSDYLASPSDVKYLCEEVLPVEQVYGMFQLPNHNHIDYMFSRHRRQKTYETIYEILGKINTLL